MLKLALVHRPSSELDDTLQSSEHQSTRAASINRPEQRASNRQELLSEPTSAACHVDELECLKDLDLDETPLDEYITYDVRFFPQAKYYLAKLEHFPGDRLQQEGKLRS